MGGHGFGNLGVTIRGIIYYKISHHEQRAFAGWVTKGIPNTIRRMKEEVWNVVPPFLVYYTVYDLANKEHARLQRKNPADYENDE